MSASDNHANLIAFRKKWLAPTLVGLASTILFLIANVYKPQAIEQVSNVYFDLLQRQYPRPYDPGTPVRIIDLDDESITKIGQWPWPRTEMARLNTRLGEAGAAVVAYDVVFSEADRTSPENMIAVLNQNPRATGDYGELPALQSHDEIFAESFQFTRIVTGFFLLNTKSETLPQRRQGFSHIGGDPIKSIDNWAGTLHSLSAIENSADGSGHLSFRPDRDGVIRKAPLLGRVDDRLFPSLSVEALRAVQGASTFILKSSNASGEHAGQSVDDPEMVSIKVGDFEIPTTSKGELLMHYTKAHPERYVPAWKVLSNRARDQDWLDLVNGHIVFVGTSAEGLKDLRATPMSGSEPGVLIHAQAVEQILAGDFLYRPYWAGNLEFFTILVLGGIMALLLPRLSATKGVILILMIGNGIAIGSLVAFVKYNYLLDPVYPLLAILTSYVLITLTSFYMTEAERSQIRGAFSMYLSPTMVKRVSEDPALLTLGGEEREITILFLDVRSFSRISETMRPQDITNFLNKFLTPMTEILQNREGTIDKYIGDAIVAFWNAPLDDPEHQRNAARSILDMQKELTILNEKYRKQSEIRWPEDVRVGIGVNTGVCCVGNLGSRQRFSYSMIGDAANLASRIEGLTKQYGVSALVGANTANFLHGFALLEADEVSVVGREATEKIYMLLGDEETSAKTEFQTFKSLHIEFLEAYRAREWDHALELASTLTEKGTVFGVHRYYTTLSARISDYMTTPPPTDWNGVFVAQSK